MSELNETNLVSFFKKIECEISKKTVVIFSLDADALTANEVPGVSAVNPAGLSRAQLLTIWRKYLALNKEHPHIIGIYELNPLYDTLASLSMRTMASFIFETF
jgi:arginase family enzyme